MSVLSPSSAHGDLRCAGGGSFTQLRWNVWQANRFQGKAWWNSSAQVQRFVHLLGKPFETSRVSWNWFSKPGRPCLLRHALCLIAAAPLSTAGLFESGALKSLASPNVWQSWYAAAAGRKDRDKTLEIEEWVPWAQLISRGQRPADGSGKLMVTGPVVLTYALPQRALMYELMLLALVEVAERRPGTISHLKERLSAAASSQVVLAVGTEARSNSPHHNRVLQRPAHSFLSLTQGVAVRAGRLIAIWGRMVLPRQAPQLPAVVALGKAGHALVQSFEGVGAGTIFVLHSLVELGRLAELTKKSVLETCILRGLPKKAGRMVRKRGGKRSALTAHLLGVPPTAAERATFVLKETLGTREAFGSLGSPAVWKSGSAEAAWKIQKYGPWTQRISKKTEASRREKQKSGRLGGETELSF